MDAEKKMILWALFVISLSLFCACKPDVKDPQQQQLPKRHYAPPEPLTSFSDPCEREFRYQLRAWCMPGARVPPSARQLEDRIVESWWVARLRCK